MNILLAGIGYTNLSDLSFGRVLHDRIAAMPWPEAVHVEDLNYGPIMIYQWFEEARTKFDKAIFVSAAKRGRKPGSLEVYRWSPGAISDAEIQARIEEAVTGVISLDNLLIICRHFAVLPDDVTVVEVEPARDDWGEQFSPVVSGRVQEAIDAVRGEVQRVMAPQTASAN